LSGGFQRLADFREVEGAFRVVIPMTSEKGAVQEARQHAKKTIGVAAFGRVWTVPISSFSGDKVVAWVVYFPEGLRDGV